MCKTAIKSIVLAVFLLLNNPAYAGLEEGINAANIGDFETALREFNYLNDMNYAPGTYELGKLYEQGFGVTKNPHKAAELYQKAVDLNLGDAMFALAVMYQEGKGVKLDKQRAVELFKQAAHKGLAAAQFNLGVMYTNGDGVLRDYRAAIKWYYKAAEQNYSLAQFNLALMYYDGLGVEKSVEKSYIWNSIAEYNGNKEASKSRRLDEKKMLPDEIEAAKEKADAIYGKILKGEYTYIPDNRRI